MPSAFPTGTDLATFLSSIGATAITTDRATALADAAVSEFLKRTERRSWLTTADTTKTFDSPERSERIGFRVDMKGWTVLASPAPVVKFISHADLSETTLERVDYRFWEVGAGADGEPYSSLILRSGWGQGSITVTGTFGASATVPNDMFEAILRRAAISALAEKQGAGEVQRIKQGPVEYEYSDDNSRINLYRQEFESVVGRYRLIL